MESIRLNEYRAFIAECSDVSGLSQCDRAISYMDTELTVIRGMASHNRITQHDFKRLKVKAGDSRLIGDDPDDIFNPKFMICKRQRISELLGSIKDSTPINTKWFITEIYNVVNYYMSDMKLVFDNENSADEAHSRADKVYSEIVEAIGEVARRYKRKRLLSTLLPFV